MFVISFFGFRASLRVFLPLSWGASPRQVVRWVRNQESKREVFRAVPSPQEEGATVEDPSVQAVRRAGSPPRGPLQEMLGSAKSEVM
jgi:hypothetical protein